MSATPPAHHYGNVDYRAAPQIDTVSLEDFQKYVRESRSLHSRYFRDARINSAS